MVLFFLSLFPQHRLQGHSLLSNVKSYKKLDILAKDQPTDAEGKSAVFLLSGLSMVKSKIFNLSNLRGAFWLVGEQLCIFSVSAAIVAEI